MTVTFWTLILVANVISAVGFWQWNTIAAPFCFGLSLAVSCVALGLVIGGAT